MIDELYVRPTPPRLDVEQVFSFGQLQAYRVECPRHGARMFPPEHLGVHAAEDFAVQHAACEPPPRPCPPKSRRLRAALAGRRCDRCLRPLPHTDAEARACVSAAAGWGEA